MSVQAPARASAGLATRTNPRRTAPEHSVSLRRPQPISTSPSSEDESDPPSNGNVSAASNVAVQAERPTPPIRKTSDGPTAEKWFDESNQNATGKKNARFIDDDPPFYLPKQQSSEDESGGQVSLSPGGPRLGFGLASGAGGSNDSSRDDYRSVIDDLTVENQDLKRKLRKYQGLHSAHMQDDKLFEVRVYKLSQARRRRLEGMLRDFVSGLGRSPPDGQSPGTLAPFASLPYHQAPAAHTKRSGSSTSNKPVDSAYASMSASGGTSSQTQNNLEPRRPIRPAPEKATPAKEQRPAPPKDQRVQSYLQTISRRLLPKYPPVMTEKTKKRLVVRRLEQLFVGRTGNATNHSQSQQQQEVSQSAAIADREETEAMGHRVQAEGRREAHMLLRPPSEQANPTAEVVAPPPAENVNNSGNGTGSPPDQRPTRPLDLDPARAQNPAETINYMKHLGFSSPKMDPTRPYGTEEGWIYLNLLINMAQLHTLNVTPSFVRNAILELSTQFEMSEDGQNIRWKGGPKPSKLSSDSSTNSDGSADSPPQEQPGRRAHAHAHAHAHGKISRGSGAERTEPARTHPSAQHGLRHVRNWPLPRMEDQFYSPIFYNPDDANSGSPTQEGVSSNSLLQPEDRSGGISGGSTSLENLKSSSKADSETGNLIFYNRARFCTDLLGDPTLPPSNAVYERRTQQIMGVAVPASVITPNSETKRQLSGFGLMPLKEQEIDLDSIEELHGFDDAIASKPGNPRLRAPHCLPACGVGGVIPSDNFCIDVRRAFRRRKSRIVGISVRDLAPTPLPPPSYAFLPYSSSGSDTEDSSDEEENPEDQAMAQFAAELNERHFVPSAFLGEFSSQSGGSRLPNRFRGTGASGRRSSLDMLEFARKADPKRVARGGREYEEAHLPGDEVDQVPPPGSVAATVGDHSTFLTSQEDNASVDERHLRMMQERRPGMKRERSDFSAGQQATKPKKERRE